MQTVRDKQYSIHIEIINLGETPSVLNQFIAELRDVHIQHDSLRFRRNIERIGEVMAYEISKRLSHDVKAIQTPLGIAPMSLPDERLVIGTILRAGLPFHQGFLNIFDRAGSAFVSAFRQYTDPEHQHFDIHIEYIASPRLEGKTLLLVDPMLATGSSMELAYQALLTKGQPDHIHAVAIIASQQAVDYMEQLMPAERTTLWVAAIDPELNENAYIVPGLGDAGNLAFGDKD